MSTWTQAPERPGYRRKVIQHGAATITIYRPELDEAEAAKATETTRTALESAMRAYIRSKTA